MKRVPGSAALLLTLAVAGAAAGTYTEDFTTTTFRDPVETTADWNTVAGELRLGPFTPSLLGSQDTPGVSLNLALFEGLAVIADDVGGLQIVDVSDPENPGLLASLATPGYATDVVVSGQHAFVADFGAGLQVVSLDDPASPAIVGTYNTPNNARGVAVAGDLAFVADGTTGLVILDISDPTLPTLLGTFNTPGTAVAVEVAGDLAYVADSNSGVRIVDISDPTAPASVGAYDTPGTAYAVAVAGDRAFVADYGALRVLDVSNPAGPAEVGSFPLAYAQSVALSGDLALVSDGFNGLRVFDITTPASPALLHTVATPDYAFAVAAGGPYAYVAQYSSGLQVIGFADPKGAGQNSEVPTRNLAQGIAVDGDFAFVADRDSGLTVFDVSDVANPFLVGSHPTGGFARGVEISGDLALVAAGFAGLQVFDVSDPASPVLLGTADTPGEAWDLAVAGDHVYVADAGSGLRVVDISDPTSPQVVGSYDTPGMAFDVSVAGDLVAIADGTGGARILDVSDPTAPASLSTYTGVTNIQGVSLTGNRLYLVSYLSGLRILDVSAPGTPVLLGSYSDFGSNWTDVAVDGDRAFLANSFWLTLVDISDPTTPVLSSRVTAALSPLEVTVSGSHAFMADANLSQGLHIIQVLEAVLDPSAKYGQSTPVDGDADTIIRARVQTTQTTGASVSLSANGGTDFLSFTPGTWNKFSASGSELVWRITLGWNPAFNPTVSQITIDWLHEYGSIASVEDVPDDQGGWVRLRLDPSGYDFANETTVRVTGYQVYQRVDGNLAAQVEAEGRPAEIDPRMDTGLASLSAGSLRTLGDRTFVLGEELAAAGTFPPGTWEAVAWVAATQTESYTVRVPTVADSSGSGPGWSVFFVTTHTTTPTQWFASAPDSGASVDNIAPGVPSGFAATYGAGSIDLTWDPAPEEDFQYFRVYRGTVPGFLPGPGTLVHETASTAWQDTPPDPGSAFYKITALDHAGNESEPAGSGSVVAVGDPGSAPRFALRGAAPNPLRAGTRIAFQLAHDTPVSLEVYDVTGRRVRAFRENLGAGAHEISWDARDEGGRRVAAGVYLYRLRAGAFEATRRLVVID